MSGPRRVGAFALELALAAALAGTVGLGIGWLSRSFFVAGLWSVVVGVAAGAAVAFVATLTGGPWRGLARVATVAAVLTGWLAAQTMEDHGFRAAFADQVARQRAISDALPPELLREESARALLGRGAERQLAELLERQVGRSDAVGRWLYRADHGVRLIGPVDGGRGLDVGRGGAVAWAAAEIVLATWLAWVVLRRGQVRARAAASAAELEDLQ